MSGIEIGFAVATFALTLGLAVLLNNRYMLNKIATGDAALVEKIQKGDEQLHSRVNGVRDEYVRRDDLSDRMKHLADGQKHLEDGQGEMRKEQRRMNERLDAVLAELVKDKD